MKFTVTLHLMPVAEKGEPDEWSGAIKVALEAIPGVQKAEVEPEGRKGIGEQ